MESTMPTLNVSTACNIAVPTISSSATLVDFTYSVPTLKRKDRRVTDEVLINNRAESGAGEFRKSLLPNCKELKELQNLGQRIRQTHYRWTLPWTDIGSRLLPTGRLPDYMKLMDEHEAEFFNGVQAVLDVYDWEIIQAKTKLGDLFEPNKYPTSEDFARLFKWSLAYHPLPETGDFRVDVGNEMMDVLKSNYEENNRNNIDKVVGHVVHEVRKVLTQLSRQLQNNKPYDTTVGQPTKMSEDGKTILHYGSGVYGLLELMRTCNITKDTQIEAARVKLEAQFLGSGVALSKEVLSVDETLRDQTQAVIDDVVKSLPTLDM